MVGSSEQAKAALTDLDIPEALVDPSLVLAMRGVEVIFDAVVRATGQLFGDVGPLVSQFFVQIENLFLLHFVDWSLVDVRVEMVVPPERKYLHRSAECPWGVQSESYLSRHYLPVRVRILNFSSSLLATKVHFLVPYSLTSSTIAASS